MILDLVLHTLLFPSSSGTRTLIDTNDIILELIATIRTLSHHHRTLCSHSLTSYLVLFNAGLIFSHRVESFYLRDSLTELVIQVTCSHRTPTLASSVIEDVSRIEGIDCENDVLLCLHRLMPYHGARCRVSFATVPLSAMAALEQLLGNHSMPSDQQKLVHTKCILSFISGGMNESVQLSLAVLHVSMQGNRHIFYGQILLSVTESSQKKILVFSRRCMHDR